MLRLELVDIVKTYPGVRANDGVCLKVEPGEIHAVLGENGAGKSTLMKIIYGIVQPDAGEVRWNGANVNITSPEKARKLGIAMVFQHFSLFDTLTVAENVWLGLDRRTSLAEVTGRIETVAGDYGLAIDPRRPVHSLSVGERQRVEIVRALLGNPKLLILDEPTSVLTPQAIEKLFATLRKLAEHGCSILYISHKLDEIRALCRSCTVLRAGRVTGNPDPTTATNAELSRLMIGAEPPKLERSELRAGDVVLDVKGLNVPRPDAFGVSLVDVRVSVRAGEIVGVAGVSGNGQKELLSLLSGEVLNAPRGSIELFGRDVTREPPRARRDLGLRFVPEERLGRATVATLSLAENTLLTRTESVRPGGWLDRTGLSLLARRLIDTFRVKARSPAAPAKSLSGGNLQKFIVGREVEARPRALIVSQPTWGVDVGASAQIRSELVRLRDEGTAILVVSEELDELFEISDFLVVIAAGRLSPRIATRDATALAIGEWMSGLWPLPPEQASESGNRAHHAEA
ncbi:MAG TPA: ABC transporter ATP-binding protein [Polyangiaceae bacterium]|nr:ABC transporter ATP-binding protein [Polyangiaceae bacterium]